MVKKNQPWKSKVKKILEDSLDSIPSPSPSVKIQIMGGKVGLRCKGKTLLGIVNKLCCTKSLLTTPSNVLPLPLKPTFPPIIWIFTECKGDGIESRLSSKIYFTLMICNFGLANLFQIVSILFCYFFYPIKSWLQIREAKSKCHSG